MDFALNATLAPVSVVIPCYRCEETITRALSSVFAQTWRPAEVILVEDCSGDETLARLYALQSEYPLDWVRVLTLPQNGGPGTARNTGWECATQPYIAFLDADDAWHHEKIQVQLGWMIEHPEVALTGHPCRVVSTIGDSTTGLLPRDNLAFKRVGRHTLLLSNRFSTPTVILKRDLPHRFMCGKRHSEDYLLWCEICLDGYPCYRSRATLAFLFKAAYGEAGLSGDLWLMELGELDCYARLRKSGGISWPILALLCGFSLMKYLKRLATVGRKSIGAF